MAAAPGHQPRFIARALTLLLALTLALIACTPPTPAAVAAVTSVTIKDSAQIVQVDGTLTLEAEVTTQGDADSTVTWKSSDENVATINNDGELKALAFGTTTITAESVFDPEQSDSVEITVKLVPAVLRVTINESDPKLPVGFGFQLTFEVETEGAADSAVLWESSDEAVTTVNEDGELTTLEAGVTTITATSPFDASKSDTVEVTVFGAPEELWTVQIGTTHSDEGNAAATHPDGSIIIAVRTTGHLEAGAPTASAAVQKLDPDDGSIEWTHQFGTTGFGNEYAGSVATHTDGSIIVAGWTRGDLAEPHNGGAFDGYVRKLSTDGAHAWTHQVGSETGSERVSGVAFDADGNTLIVGSTTGDLDGTVTGTEDAFVRKLTSLGQEVWTDQFGTSQNTVATDVAVDADGNIIVVGWTVGDLESESYGGRDGFIRKFSSAGAVIWTKQFGTNGLDEAHSVTIDFQGSIIIAGRTSGDLEGDSAGGMDAFVQKRDADGNHIWTHQFGSSAHDEALSVASDTYGNIIVVGFTEGDLEGVGAGEEDAFVRKLNADGVTLWTEQFGTSALDWLRGVAIEPEDDVIVVGSTVGTLGEESHGGHDIFVRKYSP